jgi:hypothetical protein
VRFQKLMWRNMMRSTKSKKDPVLHYSIDLLEKSIIKKIRKTTITSSFNIRK